MLLGILSVLAMGVIILGHKCVRGSYHKGSCPMRTCPVICCLNHTCLAVGRGQAMFHIHSYSKCQRGSEGSRISPYGNQALLFD